MTNNQWYYGLMKSGLLSIPEQSGVYIRKLQSPSSGELAVGPTLVLFSTELNKSVRLCESLLREQVKLHPNHVNPQPAPETVNEQLETLYQAFLHENPVAKRGNKEYRNKAHRKLRSLTPSTPELS